MKLRCTFADVGTKYGREFMTVWTNMYARHVDMFMIPKWGIPMVESRRERPLKIYRKIGSVRYAEWARICSRSRNDQAWSRRGEYYMFLPAAHGKGNLSGGNRRILTDN